MVRKQDVHPGPGQNIGRDAGLQDPVTENRGQGKVMEAGCKKVAVVIEDKVAILSLNDTLKQNEMQNIVKYFDNADDAWEWYRQGR